MEIILCSAITALQHHWDQLGLSMTMGRVEQRTPSSRQRSLSGHNTSLRDHWTDWSCGSPLDSSDRYLYGNESCGLEVWSEIWNNCAQSVRVLAGRLSRSHWSRWRAGPGGPLRPTWAARLQPRAIIGRLVATCLRLADQETTSTSRMDRKYRRKLPAQFWAMRPQICCGGQSMPGNVLVKWRTILGQTAGRVWQTQAGGWCGSKTRDKTLTPAGPTLHLTPSTFYLASTCNVYNTPGKWNINRFWEIRLYFIVKCVSSEKIGSNCWTLIWFNGRLLVNFLQTTCNM